MFKTIVYSLFTFLFISTASAHEWYPYRCCSGQDCHPVPCEELEELSDGRYKYQGHYFTKEQVNPSEDNKCHVCIHEFQDGVSRPMCVFTQQGS